MSRVVVAPGQTIGSAWGNQVMDQGCIVFASAAQRSTDWPAPPNGAQSWLADSNTPWIFRGGSWHPMALGWLAQGIGPATSTDYTTLATVLTVPGVPLVSGRRYRFNTYANGTQVTNAATAVYVNLVDSASQVNIRPWQTALAAGETMTNGSAYVFASGVTATTTFTLQALSNASAFRVSANACQVSVEDIGG